MSLLLQDRAQVDPKAVWLLCEDTARGPDFYMVVRATGFPLREGLPFKCGKLPHPFSSRWCQQNDEWRFTIPLSVSKDEAFEIARKFGFRTDPEDVEINGDPGYAPAPDARQKVFSARRREGRPGEDPVTVILALESHKDSNGFVSYSSLPEDDLPMTPTLYVDRTSSIFLTDAEPEEVEFAWGAQGFVQDENVVSSFRPEELFVALICDGDDEEEDLVAVFMARRDYWQDDDLRDHSLTVLPGCLAQNVSEGMWALRRGVSREQAWKELMTAGFIEMPEDIRLHI